MMVEEETKFDPVAVSVIALPPAGAVAGLIEDSMGAGSEIEKVTPPDVPPPGEGFTTATERVPPFSRSAALTCAVRVVELT